MRPSSEWNRVDERERQMEIYKEINETAKVGDKQNRFQKHHARQQWSWTQYS